MPYADKATDGYCKQEYLQAVLYGRVACQPESAKHWQTPLLYQFSITSRHMAFAGALAIIPCPAIRSLNLRT